jgi:hypothetical protein
MPGPVRNASETENVSPDSMDSRQSHGASFAKDLDGRKQPIRGLWERNGRFYAQLAFEEAITGENGPLRGFWSFWAAARVLLGRGLRLDSSP